MRHRLDLGRQRGGKEERLALLRHAIDDAADLREEAHVEHAIDFIEHEILDVLELDGAVFHEIEQPARAWRRAHPRRLLSCSRCLPKPTPPWTRPILHVHETRVIAERRLDLRREFARGFEDERAHAPPCSRAW